MGGSREQILGIYRRYALRKGEMLAAISMLVMAFQQPTPIYEELPWWAGRDCSGVYLPLRLAFLIVSLLSQYGQCLDRFF